MPVSLKLLTGEYAGPMVVFIPAWFLAAGAAPLNWIDGA
jgi:hypothetical protein